MCSNSLYKPAHHTHPTLSLPLSPRHYPTRITLPTRPKPIQIRASARSGPVTYSPPDPAASLYDVLGISVDVSLGEIKKAYKELARRYHPDVSPPGRVEEYTERFIRVQEAYETLSDPQRRAIYDGDISKGLHIAFSSRRRYNGDEQEMEDKSEWKNRWQSQLSELKRRSTYKNDQVNMSWSAKMRMQVNDSSNEA